jgi:cytochrome c
VLALLLCACAEEQPTNTPAVAAASDNSVGKTAYMRCMACHSLNAGEAHKLGPNLHSITNSSAATGENFTYSEALLNSKLVWDDATLKAWIKSPTTLVPGTKMIYANSLSDTQIDALIDYLKNS